MVETNFTTRVYQYGAVPLGEFPKEGIEFLFKANKLWNTLVEIHNDNFDRYEQERRDADEEYKLISEALDALEIKIGDAFKEKRNARIKVRTRSPDAPQIAAVMKENAIASSRYTSSQGPKLSILCRPPVIKATGGPSFPIIL